MKRRIRVIGRSRWGVAVGAGLCAFAFVAGQACALGGSYTGVAMSHQAFVPARTVVSTASASTMLSTVVTVKPPKLLRSAPHRAQSLTNRAQSDTAAWSHVDPSFYIWAQTGNPKTNTTGGSLLNLAPGQTVYLFGYSGEHGYNPGQVSWQVNSADGKFASIGGTWRFQVNHQPAAVEAFRATEPGIYTIQADDHGRHSVPLVLLVGIRDMPAVSAKAVTGASGVLPLPGKLPETAPVSAGGISFRPYPIENGWIPVSGQASAGTRNMTVVLETGKQVWSYNLPVATNGSFSDLVRAPFQGNVHVLLFNHYISQLNAGGNAYTKAGYWLNNSAPSLSVRERALLASSQMDYNLPSAAGMRETAATLMGNAPSVETGIAAVNNYVSEKVAYDYADYNAGKHVYEDAVTTWNKSLGVCEDESEVAAAMLKSAGISVQTVIGQAKDGGVDESHEWLQAWTGSHWMDSDPTWDNSENAGNHSLVNAYMTGTTAFHATHTGTETGTNW